MTLLTQIQAKKAKQFEGHSGAIYTLEPAHEKHLFFSGSSDNLVVEWDLKTGTNKAVAKLPVKAFSLQYVLERKLLFVGQSTGGVHVIDLEQQREIKLLQLHQQPIFDIKYLEHRRWLFVLGGDGLLSVWNTEDYSLVTSISLCNEKIRSIAFHLENNEAVVGCGDGAIRIIDLNTFDKKRVLQEHLANFSVSTVCYTPDKKYLLTGSRDAHLNIWEVDTGYGLLHRIPAHNYAIYSIVFSPDKKLFATCSRDRSIKIWDASTFDMLLRIDKENHDGHSNSVNKLWWSAYNNHLVSTGDDRTIKVWNIDLKPK